MDQNRDGFIDKNDLRDTFAALGVLKDAFDLNISVLKDSTFLQLYKVLPADGALPLGWMQIRKKAF